MSRRGNCHDNAVAESFFSLLKTERIKRKIYSTREEARMDIFNYIEFCYNSSRRHGHNDGLAPAEFEKQYYGKLLKAKPILVQLKAYLDERVTTTPPQSLVGKAIY